MSSDRDQAARVDALEGFLASIEIGVEEGLAKLGDLREPPRLKAALLLLNQHKRYQDAVNLISDAPLDPKWAELAVYAFVAVGNYQQAKALVDSPIVRADEVAANRTRVAFAEAAFSEQLQDSIGSGLNVRPEAPIEARDLVRAVLDVLNPLVEQVRLSGIVTTPAQKLAIEYSAHCFGFLGELSKIADLVQPLTLFKPIPLVVGDLALRGYVDVPPSFPLRLRIEHPTDFTAHLVAALIDRDLLDRLQPAFDALVRLSSLVDPASDLQLSAFCGALFETAMRLGNISALHTARVKISNALGTPNEFELLLDAGALLFENKPSDALQLLNANRRDHSGAWWQLIAVAHDAAGQNDAAEKAWRSACELTPHPSMVNSFAGQILAKKRFLDAAHLLEKAKQLAPEDTGILEKLAFAYMNLRRFQEASEVFTSLRNLEPANNIHRFNLAISMARGGRLDDSLAVLDEIEGDYSEDLRVVGLRSTVLSSSGRSQLALAALDKVRERYWSDANFLPLYLGIAHKANAEEKAREALHQILALQESGAIEEPVLRPFTLDEVIDFGRNRVSQRRALMLDIVASRLPWLFADAMFGFPSMRAWHHRTQELRWLTEDAETRGEFSIYATHGYSVSLPTGDAQKATLSRLEIPVSGTEVVVDQSALITLFKLGLLEKAREFFGRLIIPTTYSDLRLREAAQLTHHQPSQEGELKAIRRLVETHRIGLVEALTEVKAPKIDEHADTSDGVVPRLQDLRASIVKCQCLNTDEMEEFDRIARHPAELHEPLELEHPFLIGLSTLRSLASFTWFERLAGAIDIKITRQDYDELLAELRTHEHMQAVFTDHQELWQQIEKTIPRSDYLYCDRMSAYEEQHDDEESPIQLDAAILASDRNIPLLADDRVSQLLALRERPNNLGAAFGTDLLLEALAREDSIDWFVAAEKFMQLGRWRYRFLVPPPEVLKALADRSRHNLPGPELKELAAYIQESFKDAGLFCGPENADPPMPMAFRLYMDTQQACVNFLVNLWNDPAFTDAQLIELTTWTIHNLIPTIPRGLAYTPLGRRLGDFGSKGIVLFAMIQFTAVASLDRASNAIRAIAEALGLDDETYFSIAAEATNERFTSE